MSNRDNQLIYEAYNLKINFKVVTCDTEATIIEVINLVSSDILKACKQIQKEMEIKGEDPGEIYIESQNIGCVSLNDEVTMYILSPKCEWYNKILSVSSSEKWSEEEWQRWFIFATNADDRRMYTERQWSLQNKLKNKNDTQVAIDLLDI
jgi:hypothetical protein